MRRALQLLRDRPAFRTLWLGETVSQLGDWLSWVAVSLLALEHGGGEGAMALAGVLVAHSLPHAVVAPLAGDLADRFDRRRLLLVTHVLQALLTLGLIGSAVQGTLWAVPVWVALRTGVGTFAEPARAAILPAVVAPDEVLLANTVSSSTWSVAFSGGMALGGVVASFGPVVALWADAATFGVAVAILWWLPALPAVGRGRRAEGRLAEVVSTMRADPELAGWVLAKTPLAVAGGAGLVLLQLHAAAWPFLGTAALTLGGLQALKGIGTGVGPILAARAVSRGASPWWAAGVANVAAVGTMGVFAFGPGGAVAAVAAAVWGGGTGANWVLATTGLQQRAPAAVLGRLAAVDSWAMTLGLAAGALGAGALVDATGVLAAGALPVGLALGLAAALAALTAPRVSATAAATS